MKLRNFALLLIFCSFFSAPLSARIYMQVQGVSGSAQQANHRNWCSIEAFTMWPKGAVSSAFSAGASEHSHHQMSNIVLVKKLFDRASPALAQRAATNANIPKITIHFTTKMGGGEKTIISYVFNNCRITGMEVSVTQNNRMPMDELEFRYQHVKIVYTPLNDKGQAGQAVSASWGGGKGQSGQHGHHGEHGEQGHHEEHGMLGEHGEHEEHGEHGNHKVLHGEAHRRELMERMRHRHGR